MYRVIDLDRRQGRVLFFLIVIFFGTLVTGVCGWDTIATASEDGLIGYWSFDKIEDGIVEDTSGNGNHGSVVGAVELVEGRCGKGLKLDGSTAYVNVPMNNSLKSLDAITIEAWIYPTPPHHDGYGGIINNINGYSTSRLLVVFNGSLRAQIHGATQGTYIGPNAINEDWNYVVYVYDGTEEVFYLNGQKGTPSPIAPDSQILPTGDRALTIGLGYPTTYYFNGIIDEFKIYNRALSQEEIEYSYNNPHKWKGIAIVM